MRLEHLALDLTGEFHSAEHLTDGSRSLRLSEGLNVVDTVDESTNHQLADLVGHVLYGARLASRDWQLASPPLRAPAGYVDISGRLGRFRLQRHSTHVDRGTFSEPRLTVAPLDGQPADAQTAKALLGGLSPAIVSRLFVLDVAGGAQLDWLLSEELATEMRRLEQRSSPRSESPQRSVGWSEELFTRRDDLTQQIESLLAGKRQTSEGLERALDELLLAEKELARTIAGDRRELDRVVMEMAELESHLRYQELEELTRRETDKAHHADQQPALAELDVEIERWRKGLADLEAREAHVRAELTRLHPDDSSPSLSLADQRAAVAVAQRLVSDLDSEIARFARPGDSRACLCGQAHARLHPLVDTLTEQISKVAHLIAGYEAALESEQLKLESQHLARSQAELRATLEHLLDRRQMRFRTSRVRPTHDFVEQPTEEQRRTLVALDQRRIELADNVERAERRRDELEARRHQLHQDRVGLMEDPALLRLREEFDKVSLQLAHGEPRLSQIERSIAPWRASDILAKLTDGRLREVRLIAGGREVNVVDRHGLLQSKRQLSEVDLRLVSLSLQLATVAATSRWGIGLPLVLADPLAELPAPTSAILSLVLHDFARAGHQLVVFTSSQPAIQRWLSMGQPILNLQPMIEPVPVAERPPRETFRVVSQPPSVNESESEADSFALRLDDSIERFGVFGEETKHLFATHRIRTVDDLVRADAGDVADSLGQADITTSVVEMWQTHLVLLCFVPDLSLDEAQLLTGANVWDLEQLGGMDEEVLYDAIRAYLDSPQGNRHRTSGRQLSKNYCGGWISGARRNLSRWKSSSHARRWGNRHQNRSQRTSRRRESASPSTRNGRPATSRTPREEKKRALRFRLSRTSPIVDAPSIGPKTSKRLARVGVTTVADLLAADAEATASALDVRQVDGETIVAWQHQAQLMCRIPELLARDTQLLVGCGFSTAEGIAAAEAADLLEFAKSYAATSEGTRVLRGSDPPDLDRVTKWIRWAGHRRALEAA